MTIKNLITIPLFCTLWCAGAQQAAAQKIYKQGDAIVLDCGPGSGFPQGAVEPQKGKKIASGTPSNSSGPMANNTETGTINKTIYQKLEVAQANVSNLTWADAYLYCQAQGEYWRLPTQRELMLIYIFKDAVAGLGATAFAAAGYWSGTEASNSYSYSWNVRFGTGNTYDANGTKTTTGFITRCVREL